MLSIRPIVQEGIQKLNTSAAFRPSHFWIFFEFFFRVVLLDGLLPFFLFPIWAHLIQNFDFIISGFKIILAGFLNFQSDVSVVLVVFWKPHGWKMSPTKFLDDNVSVQKHFSNMNGVIASNFVIRHSFILAWVR